MKNLVLAAAILLAGTIAASAQRSGGGDGRDGRDGREGRSGRISTPAPVVVVKPAPAPVRVFVPVPVPTIAPWNRSEHRYSQRRHSVCQEKSHRLHSYERHAANDGYLSGRERWTIQSLRRELAWSCGGHRWRG